MGNVPVEKSKHEISERHGLGDLLGQTKKTSSWSKDPSAVYPGNYGETIRDAIAKGHRVKR